MIRYEFNGSTKSKLGWDFLAVIETGRFRDWRESTLTPGPSPFQGEGSEQAEFWRQVEHCQMEIVPGPERRMKWGVPDGTRDAANGELVHDDLVVSSALCSVLDRQTWGLGVSEVVAAIDPLADLREAF